MPKIKPSKRFVMCAIVFQPNLNMILRNTLAICAMEKISTNSRFFGDVNYWRSGNANGENIRSKRQVRRLSMKNRNLNMQQHSFNFLKWSVFIDAGNGLFFESVLP